MLLSAVMVMTDAGISVSAAENTASAEMVDENLTEGTDEGKTAESADREAREAKTAETENPESRTTGIETESAAESKVEETAKETQSQESMKSVSSETESAEERTTQGTESEPEESTIEEHTEEKTSAEESKPETASSVETETAEVEETSSVENAVEETQTEENISAETTAEDIQTEETVTGETETETEVQETETQETLAEDVIAQGAYKEDGNDITWVIDLDGKLTVTGTGDCAPVNDLIRDIPWRKHSDSIKSAVLDVKGMTSAANLFSLCDKMTSVDLSKFDTSQIVSMRTMFLDCSSLQSIDLSGFDTSNVHCMMSMFYGCSSLKTLDLSSFDTSKVTNMKSMFTDCSSLTYVDMSSFDVSNTCKENDSLYAYGSGMEDLFSGCIALSEIKTPRNVPESESPSLPHGTVWNGSDGSAYTELPIKSESITLTKSEIEGVIAQGEYKENGNDITWVIDRAGKLTVTGTGNYAELDSSSDDVIEAPWYDFRNTIISAEIHLQGTTNAERMFYGCNQMVEADLTDFDTHSVTTMNMMFFGCKSLTSLDLSKFSFSSIITDEEDDVCVGGMLSQCDTLAQIQTPDNITISITLPEGIWQDSEGSIYTELPKGIQSVLLTKEESTQFIAQGAYQEDGNDITWTIDTDGKLIVRGTGNYASDSAYADYHYKCAPWYEYRNSIKMAEIHVQGMTNAAGMFSGCTNLISVDVKDLDTSNITSMRSMFAECLRLRELHLEGFVTENVRDMGDMFLECSSLTEYVFWM